ncbi:MAG: Rieske (2Fe-2S) protein [Verrucomicrobia bacterium]|nr:Rieske (2Fe-2S) protein [Verrucomicrobiota bacterium]
MQPESPQDNSGQAPAGERREFLKKALSAALGGATMAAPAAAGLAVYLDPLRRKAPAGRFVRVTTLEALPADGSPKKFPIIVSRVDAWNKTPATPVGAVYVRRTKEGALQAHNVACPHAGCFVDFQPERNGYFCPCHNSTFGLDGKIADEKSPSPRGLDELKVELRNEKEVWVHFQNFHAGHAKKIPVA